MFCLLADLLLTELPCDVLVLNLRYLNLEDLLNLKTTFLSENEAFSDPMLWWAVDLIYFEVTKDFAEFVFDERHAKFIKSLNFGGDIRELDYQLGSECLTRYLSRCVDVRNLNLHMNDCIKEASF